MTSGRSSIEAAKAVLKPPTAAVKPVATVRAVVAPPPHSPAPLKAKGGLTVGELAARYLRYIKATKPKYRGSSLWHGALAATRAVRPVGAMPAAAFGSRALA